MAKLPGVTPIMVTKVNKAEIETDIEDDIEEIETENRENVRDLSATDINNRMMVAAASNKVPSRWLDEEDDDDGGPRSHVQGDMLTFNKGDWGAGKAKVDVPIGTRMIVDMDSYEHGWVRWHGPTIVDERVGKYIDRFKAPEQHELGFLDQSTWDTDSQGKRRDPWQRTVYLLMRAESDPNAVYTFTPTSVGGLNAVRDLKDAFKREFKYHKPDARPIVELGVDSYKHKNPEFGKIKVPTFDVVGWTDGPDQSSGRIGVTVIPPRTRVRKA
jgi:hypothetical protein